MRKNKEIILGVAVIFFALITFIVLRGSTEAIDLSISEAIQSLRSPGLTTLVETITYTGNWQAIAIIAILLLAFPEKRKIYGYKVASVAVIASGLNRILKEILQRGRPEEALHLIEEGGFSFPSGHTSASMAVYGMLAYLVIKNVKNKKKAYLLGAGFGILPIIIGISRIYLGVHFPTDILAGWIEGIAVIMLVLIVFDYIKKKKPELNV